MLCVVLGQKLGNKIHYKLFILIFAFQSFSVVFYEKIRLMFAFLISSATKMNSYDDAIKSVILLKQKIQKTQQKGNYVNVAYSHNTREHNTQVN